MIAIERLADVFVEVADTLVVGFDLIEFLHNVTRHAAEMTGCTVGLVLVDERGQLQVMGASDGQAEVLELFQVQQRQGPCHDCFSTGVAVVDTDLPRASERWPEFAPLAVSAGVQSVHAFPMRLRDRVIGALNVFGREQQALSADEVRVVQALADVATISLIQEQAIARAEVVNEQLQAALNSRIVIEQAKGAVARALSISVDEAFTLMRTRARADRVRLTAYALELLDDREAMDSLREPG
jgi:GAF domain-containing protein